MEWEDSKEDMDKEDINHTKEVDKVTIKADMDKEGIMDKVVMEGKEDMEDKALIKEGTIKEGITKEGTIKEDITKEGITREGTMKEGTIKEGTMSSIGEKIVGMITTIEIETMDTGSRIPGVLTAWKLVALAVVCWLVVAAFAICSHDLFPIFTSICTFKLFSISLFF